MRGAEEYGLLGRAQLQDILATEVPRGQDGVCEATYGAIAPWLAGNETR